MNVQSVASNLPDVREFLREYSATTLFLSSNLDAHGPALTDHPNSGHFQCIVDGNDIVGVFALTRRGNLLVELGGRTALAPLVVGACAGAGVATRGVLGEWSSANATWQELQRRGLVVEHMASKEVLFSLPLAPCLFAPSSCVRRLGAVDYDSWKLLNDAYLTELGLSAQMSSAQQRANFTAAAAGGHWWGYWLEGKLVSIAGLNARHEVLGQVGGVFTAIDYRRLGYSRQVLQTLACDSRSSWSLAQLILFTGQDNTNALGLYRSLDFEPIGEFAMFFGQPTSHGDSTVVESH